MSTSAKLAGDGRKMGALTRAEAINALREYAGLYGPDFPSSAFNPGTAKWAGRSDLIERYYQGRPDGRSWPSLNAIKGLFGGSFDRAREAAGLPKNKRGPRRSGAAPIRDVRVQRVMVESDRDRELRGLLERERERSARLRAALEQERAKPARVRERVVRERVPAKAKTKTITKTVKVRDERAIERLRAKLADEQAVRRASEDQLRSAVKDRDESRRLAEIRAREVAVALAEAKNATEAMNRMSDRLEAAEGRVERLRGELESVQLRDASAAEAAAVSNLVRDAEARAERAEIRAARAEREMAEQAAAITGEMRKLTTSEIAALRAKGPSGPGVLAAALKKVAAARAGVGDLNRALHDVARAAETWRGTL